MDYTQWEFALSMQERIVQFSQRLLPLLDRLTVGVEWLLKQIIRAWGWLNSINIPLSPLQWILVLYVIFGMFYTVSTPVFEANDELWHFGVVQYIRETGDLPIQVFDGTDTIYQQHGSQPPLYYGLMALITSPLSIDDVDDYRALNPHVTDNQPNSFGNKNLVLRDESLPMFAGTGLTVVVIRMVGLALGLVTIVAIYEIGKYIAPQRPTVAFVAAAITGLNPMFIFVSVSVNNDVLAIALNSVIVLLMLRTLRDGFNTRYSIIIALLLALTCVTKLTSIVLIPVVIGVGYFNYRKTRDRQGLMFYFFAALVFVAVFAGWWYVRNVQLYSEPFGMITMANIAGPRGVTFGPLTLLTEYQQFRMSFWGLFGVMNIQISPLFYMLTDLVSFFSLLGIIFLVLQLLAINDFAYARYELNNLLVLISGVLLVWLGVMYWSTLTNASQGRIMFPLIAMISPVIAVGFVEFVWWIIFSLRPPNLDFVRAGDAVPQSLLNEAMLWPLRFLGLVAILAPMTVIATQYGTPEPINELPPRANPVYAEFGDVALVGYERVDRRYLPGEEVAVTLFWEVLEQSERDNSIFMSFVDVNGQEIGRYSSYPGAGTLRTSVWEVGDIYPDKYVIAIDQGAFGRYPFDLQVEWENLEINKSISATNAEGDMIEPVLLDMGAVVSVRLESLPQGFAEIQLELQPNFDEAIRLHEFFIDTNRNEVILHWQAENTLEDNYTVFVHVLDEDGDIVEQSDIPPSLPTRYWRWGEKYLTYHQFSEDIDLLEHTIVVGWYLNDGLSYLRLKYERVGEVTEEGEALKFDTYEIPWDVAYESLELTAEVTPEVTSEVTDDADKEDQSSELETPEARRSISGTSESTEEPNVTIEATDEPESTVEATEVTESTEEADTD
jgi:4-amino-4-deoxy-L-arabinose transferase-like glycosyltransferase